MALRYTFYRDNYRRILFGLALSVLLNVLLSGGLFYWFTHPPQSEYFATSIYSRLTPLTALDRPNQSDSSVLLWSTQAAISAYTLNFGNYQSQLALVNRFFTRNGWSNFITALNRAQVLQQITAEKLEVTTVATKAPVILDKGVLNGLYSWRIQLPILVNFQGSGDRVQRRFLVTMLVTRVPTKHSARGIGIAQFVVGPM